MPIITFPDGSVKNFSNKVNSFEIAENISPSLAKVAIASKINDDLWDLSREIEEDSSIEIITKKNVEALDLIRHACAHIMAESVLEIFPETQVTIGPTIDNGFYYDFFRETPFTTNDLVLIEKKCMK